MPRVSWPATVAPIVDYTVHRRGALTVMEAGLDTSAFRSTVSGTGGRARAAKRGPEQPVRAGGGYPPRKG